MPGRTERLVHQIAAAAREDDAATAAELQHAVEDLLERIAPADDLALFTLDFGSGSATVLRHGRADPDFARELVPVCEDHPAVISYLGEPADLTPRRISDVCADDTWRTSRTFREVFAQRAGRYQLSVMTDLTGDVGRGWVAVRRQRDFTDAELELAISVAPLARLVGRLDPAHAGAGPLTRREAGVLDLVAHGLTADAIARTLGIAPGTVRKHLEHTYEKLGVHDRLLAVERARVLGVLR